MQSLLYTHVFARPFSLEHVPGGHRCDWCRGPAEYHVTAIGGSYHNIGGYFCPACAETFCALIATPVPAQRIKAVLSFFDGRLPGELLAGVGRIRRRLL
jgi:hypothetical protein